MKNCNFHTISKENVTLTQPSDIKTGREDCRVVLWPATKNYATHCVKRVERPPVRAWNTTMWYSGHSRVRDNSAHPELLRLNSERVPLTLQTRSPEIRTGWGGLPSDVRRASLFKNRKGQGQICVAKEASLAKVIREWEKGRADQGQACVTRRSHLGRTTGKTSRKHVTDRRHT